MRIVVVADPLPVLQPAHDSTVAIVEAAQERGHEVLVTTTRQLSVRDTRAHAACRQLTVVPATLAGGRWRAVADWWRVGAERDACLDDADAVLMRTDPPVDGDYLRATYLLDQVDRRVVMVNAPEGLRAANEKLFILRFPELVPDTVVTADIGEAVDTVRRWGRAVLKPTDGMAGRGILRLCPGDPNIRSILETATARGRSQVVVQRYLDEAGHHGDRRVIVLDGEPIGVVRRVAAPGEFRCNMAAGADVVADEVTPADKHVCSALAPELARLGLVLAGIDVIGDRLTEVNVTSPTGLREIDALSGTRLPHLVVEHLERAVAGRRP
ncbi:glutathione synthase [Pseudonocardia sp.]|uniref:glutathione synthase n=1 Tax=Pseudonocardia sp. TaxID=60912 RepID=UPI003D1481D2